MPPEEEEPAVRITLTAIYHEVLALGTQVRDLTNALPLHVSITKEKQDEYEKRLDNHGTRLGESETRLARLESLVKPRTPWYVILGAIVGILTGIGAIASLLVLLSRITII